VALFRPPLHDIPGTILAFTSNSFSKAHCYFQASDNEDGAFWISASPQGDPLKPEGRIIDIGLRLGTPMKEADAYRFACNPPRARREQEFLTRDAVSGL
jgi:hypothetical protein